MFKNANKAVLAEIKLISDLYVRLNPEGREFVMQAMLQAQDDHYLQKPEEVAVSQVRATMPRIVPVLGAAVETDDELAGERRLLRSVNIERHSYSVRMRILRQMEMAMSKTDVATQQSA